MPACPTVKIKDGDGFMTINADKYDPKRHRLFGEPDPVVPKAKASYSTPANPDDAKYYPAKKSEAPKKKYQRRRKAD